MIRYRYTVAGKRRAGWAKYLPYCQTALAAKQRDAARRAFQGRDVRAFIGPLVGRVGPGDYASVYEVGDEFPTFVSLFALPRLPTLDVIELCRVGSHNDFSDAGRHMDEARDDAVPGLAGFGPRGDVQPGKR